MDRIGFIGLGHIGRPMAMNLLRAGFSVTIHDHSETALDGFAAQGAIIAGSAREVGAGSDLIAIAVVDDAQLRSVVLGPDGVLAGATKGSVIVIHSTVSPDVCRSLAAQCEAVGLSLVDAPVSGGGSGAIEGTLTLLVGGHSPDIDRCRDVFAVVGERVFHLGDVGAGQIAKICNNLMFTVNLRAALEALRLADAAGLDQGMLREIGARSTADSWALTHIDEMREMIDASLQSRTPVEIGNKDLSLATALGHALGIETPIAAFTAKLQQ